MTVSLRACAPEASPSVCTRSPVILGRFAGLQRSRFPPTPSARREAGRAAAQLHRDNRETQEGRGLAQGHSIRW